MLPKGAFKGQDRDIYFDMDIAIERKACIDELASNFKDDGVRIKTEMAHLNMHKIKFFVLVEDPNYDVNIRTGNYRSEYNPKSLYNRIKKGIELRYNTLIRPISKDVIGSEIYNTCEAYIYETLKTRGYCSEINWREEENIWEDEKFECN
nr:MAG TPA: ATP-dependent RNA helicase [Caudoviricetes sp.]